MERNGFHLFDSEDDKYICTLDEETLKVARVEINEESRDRLNSVKALRAWIRLQQHIKCRTDTAFLLMYLRGAKFSQLRAREMIQNTLQCMSRWPEWLINIDTHEPGIQEYLSKGMHIILPKRDPERRRVMILRQGAVSTRNPHYSVRNEMRAGMAADRTMREEEETQVYGYVLLLDFTGYTMKHMNNWSIDQTKKQMKLFQDGFPGRIKSFHIYNAGSFFEGMFKFAKPFMKAKFLGRIKIHHNLESLYRFIPMDLLPSDYLPDDYAGPHAGTLQSLAESMKERVSSPEFRQHMLRVSSDEYGIVAKVKKQRTEPQASFRQMTID